MGYHFFSRLTANLNLCLIYFKITWSLPILLDHMHKKFEINRTKIKGGCQSGRKVVPHDSKSDLPLPDTVQCALQLLGSDDGSQMPAKADIIEVVTFFA